MTSAIDLSKMTPEQLAQTPAGVPPPGVTPNLVNPFNIGNSIIVASSVLMAVMMILVALRLYVAIAIKRKMGADDWTVIAAVVGSCYYFVVVCLAVKVGGYGTHMYDLSVHHMMSKNVAIISFMSNGPPHLIWPLIKTVFFLMYLQLFRPLTWLRRCVYVGLATVWTWYVSMFIAQIVITAPPPGKGWVESFATPSYLRTFKLCVPTASFSLASDVYILALPLIAISHLRLSMAKKFGVAAMFSTGIVCCVASSLSVFFQNRIYMRQDDFTYFVVFVYLTYMLEMCVGISTSCMPSLARLHKDKTRAKFGSIVSILGSPFRSMSKSANTSFGGSKVGGYPEKSPYSFMEDDSRLESQDYELSNVDTQPIIAANQHHARAPQNQTQFNVDIDQNVATPHGQRATKQWRTTPSMP